MKQYVLLIIALIFFCSVAVRNSTTFSLDSRKHHFCSVYLRKDSKTGCCALPNWSVHYLETNIIEYGEDNLSGKPISQQAKGVCLFCNPQMKVYISLMLEKKKN